MCKDLGALPEPGAMLDQDAGLMTRMRVLGHVYDTVQRIRQMHGEQIHNMSAADARTWDWLEKLGVM